MVFSVSDEEAPHFPTGTLISSPPADAKTMERITERSYYKDYRRLGLNCPNRNAANSAASILNKIDSFRISSVNMSYTVCRTYPALVVVPALTTDENIKRICKGYRGNRFPVITWRHPKTRAVIVRGSAFSRKDVMGILRGQSGTGKLFV